MALPYYSVGTATLTQGSAAMVGQGTLWATNIRPGDTVVSYSGQTAIVGSVNSDTSITLTRAFRGTSQTAAAYEIAYAPADAGVAVDVAALLNTMRSSARVGLSGVTPAARKLPYFDAAAAAALTDLLDIGRALLAPSGSPANGKIPVITGTNAAALRDILGVVSMSGGVPAGAMMEYGSNANGDYWRFANGMQICSAVLAGTVDITAGSGGGFRNTSLVSATLPAAFVGSAPCVIASPPPITSGAGAIIATAISGNDSAVSYYLWRLTSQAAVSYSFRYLAIGRWT